MNTGKSLLNRSTIFTFFPRSEERVIERLSDDRVSPNKVMRQCTATTTHPDYASRNEGKGILKAISLLMNIKLLILSAFIALGLFSCKNNGDLAPIVKTTNLNVVNASADTINFYRNGARLNNTASLVPGYEYGYLSVPSGSTVYQFKKAGNVNYLIPNYPVKLDSNTFYSLFVAGETTDKLFLIKDTTSLAPSTTAATIRFVNASPSLSLDVKIGALSFSNRAFKSATIYNYITAGAITVSIYQSGTTAPLVSSSVPLTAGTKYTLLTRGIPGGPGQNQFAAVLLIN